MLKITKTNKMKARKLVRINKSNSWFFEKISKIAQTDEEKQGKDTNY